MKQAIITILLFSISITILGAGCSATSTANINTTNNVGTNTVAIKNFTFSPSTLTVPVGTTVTWTNLDTADHTVAAKQFTSPTLTQNATYQFTFTTKGTYEYLCGIHPNMKGTIIVQ